MMRKLSMALTAVAVVALMATAAFAQPTIGGMVYISNGYDFDASKYTFDGFGRVNVSGSASDKVDYYVRLQGDWGKDASGFSLPLAYIDVKDLVGAGSTLRLGRQSITGWSVHNNFYSAGLFSGTRNAASLTVNAADNVTLRGFVDLVAESSTTEPQLGLKATFNVGAGSLGVNVRNQDVEGKRETGYSVDAAVSFAGVNLNAEFGKKADGKDIQIVGAEFDAITNAIGWNNFVEYDVAAKAWALGLSKTHDNKLTTAFTIEGGKDASTTLTTEVYVSF